MWLTIWCSGCYEVQLIVIDYRIYLYNYIYIIVLISHTNFAPIIIITIIIIITTLSLSAWMYIFSKGTAWINDWTLDDVGNRFWFRFHAHRHARPTAILGMHLCGRLRESPATATEASWNWSSRITCYYLSAEKQLCEVVLPSGSVCVLYNVLSPWFVEYISHSMQPCGWLSSCCCCRWWLWWWWRRLLWCWMCWYYVWIKIYYCKLLYLYDFDFDQHSSALLSTCININMIIIITIMFIKIIIIIIIIIDMMCIKNTIMVVVQSISSSSSVPLSKSFLLWAAHVCHQEPAGNRCFSTNWPGAVRKAQVGVLVLANYCNSNETAKP